jgi:hypothetical protein
VTAIASVRFKRRLTTGSRCELSGNVILSFLLALAFFTLLVGYFIINPEDNHTALVKGLPLIIAMLSAAK